MVAQASKPETILNGSAIAKTATDSPGWYSVTLRDGVIISFEQLVPSGDWLRLVGCVVYGSNLPSVAVSSGVIEVRAEDVRLICGSPKQPTK